jgi:hypothetical protein
MSKDVVAEAGSGDDLSKKLYASYEQFRASIMDWSDIAERAFLNARGLGCLLHCLQAGVDETGGLMPPLRGFLRLLPLFRRCGSSVFPALS